MIPKRSFVAIFVVTVVLALLWVFPSFWYKPSIEEGEFLWLQEQSYIPGWTYTNIPISQAAEAMLVGDRMSSGSFIEETNQIVVRVFSAKRYLSKENEVGLFSHTPDRCWTAAGWRLDVVEPPCLDLDVHGIRMRFERRLFTAGSEKELCYFGAVVGGKPLPYRLDQYLASGVGRAGRRQTDASSTWSRLKDNRMWGWAWESFLNRTPLGGPQQFMRLSTPVVLEDLATADARLQAFLPLWLKPADYQTEFAQWKRSVEMPSTADSPGE